MRGEARARRALAPGRLGARALCAALLLAAAPAAAQHAPERLRVLGGEAGSGLGQVTGAVVREGRVVVLTSAPAAHLFERGARRAWPAADTRAALRSPVAGQWSGGGLLVHDVGQGALLTLASDGRLAARRALPSPMMGRLHLVRGDTLMSIASFTTDAAAMVRLRGERVDTLARYALPAPIRLEASGSPSYTLPPPFAASPAWAPLANGTIAFWDGRAPELAVLDRSGRRAGVIALPVGSYPVAEADRELWLAREIPQEFMGRRVFEPLRAKARRDLRFPARLPPVLDLLADPERGVWVRRRPASSGELWAWVAAGAPPLLVSLPPGRELLAVGAAELAARHRRADGTDVVEVYRKPAPAAERGR